MKLQGLEGLQGELRLLVELPCFVVRALLKRKGVVIEGKGVSGLVAAGALAGPYRRSGPYV